MESLKAKYIDYLDAVREIILALSYIITPDMFLMKPASVIDELSSFSCTAALLASELRKICENGSANDETIKRLSELVDVLQLEIKRTPSSDFLTEHIKKETELISDGNCRETFTGLKELMDKAEGSERRRIADIILDIFCKPYRSKLENRMTENISLLSDYPYVFGEYEADLNLLPYLICKIGDSEYSLYDKSSSEFSEIIPFRTERETEWFFQNIDKPILAKEQTNIFNLEFLCDNVRRSEDYGGENHIYLYYSSGEELAPLLALCDISYILDSKKFVFLIGEKNKQKYPLDFKKEFGIDYSCFTPALLRIEEINRISYMYVSGVSGSNLLNDVIHSNPVVEKQYNHCFMFQVKYKGLHMACEGSRLFNALDDPTRKYTSGTLRRFYNDPDILFEHEPTKENFIYFIQWIERIYGKSVEFTFSDLFKAFFICMYYKDKPEQNPRIVPLMHWDAHSGIAYKFTEPVLNFKYKTALTVVRDNIISIGRAMERIKMFFFMPITSAINKMTPDLQKQFYGVHFEKFKLYPKEVCLKLCKLLNLPESQEMLDFNAPFPVEDGSIVRGYELTPLSRNCTMSLSDFDKVRLRILLSDLDKYFGYPSFDFDECPMTYEDIKYLLKFPFRFEDIYVEEMNKHPEWIHGEFTKKDARNYFNERFWLGMLKCRVGAMILPQMIDNDVGEKNG